jgi:hypothetical protein
MSIKELQKHLGTRFWTPPANSAGDAFNPDIVIRVEVTNVREQWGRTDCLIEPVDGNGSGQRWVGETTLNNLTPLDGLPA